MHDFVIMIFLKSNGYDVFTHANSSYSSTYHIIKKSKDQFSAKSELIFLVFHALLGEFYFLAVGRAQLLGRSTEPATYN
jgi:hypothetical protein